MHAHIFPSSSPYNYRILQENNTSPLFRSVLFGGFSCAICDSVPRIPGDSWGSWCFHIDFLGHLLLLLARRPPRQTRQRSAGFAATVIDKFHDFNPTRHGATGFESQERLRKKNISKLLKVADSRLQWMTREKRKLLLKILDEMQTCLNGCFLKHFNDCSKFLTSGF